MINIDDIKLFTMNGFSLAISFSDVDEALKLLLLVLSIGYTAQKWYMLYKSKNK